MTQHRHDTRVALRRAVKIFGKDAKETEAAAIQFCLAHNIEPHFRYPLGMTVVPIAEDATVPTDVSVCSEAEWQRVVKRFIADSSL